ncbi:MAG: histidine kinase [Alphaproteobacteria bacterium]
MTHFLVSDEKPDGHRLEDILTTIRRDVILRTNKIASDDRPEARHVLENNVEILRHLTDAIKLAEDSTRLLNRNLGPQVSGTPRIGVL